MGGPCFEVNFPPEKVLWNPFWAKYPICIHKMAATNASGLKKKLFCLHSWHALLTRRYAAPVFCFQGWLMACVDRTHSITCGCNQDCRNIEMTSIQRLLQSFTHTIIWDSAAYIKCKATCTCIFTALGAISFTLSWLSKQWWNYKIMEMGYL